MGEPHLLEMYLVILLFNSVEQISIVNRVVAMAKRFLTRGPLQRQHVRRLLSATVIILLPQFQLSPSLSTNRQKQFTPLTPVSMKMFFAPFSLLSTPVEAPGPYVEKHTLLPPNKQETNVYEKYFSSQKIICIRDNFRWICFI